MVLLKIPYVRDHFNVDEIICYNVHILLLFFFWVIYILYSHEFNIVMSYAMLYVCVCECQASVHSYKF